MFPKRFKPLIYVAILVVPAVFVFLRPRTFSATAILDQAVAPINAVQRVVLELQKFWFYRETYDQFVLLRKQTDLLRAKVIHLQEEALQYQRLAKILEFRRSQDFTSVTVNVIGRDPSNWDASLILDQGATEGIKVGMPVITPLGVVGKIFEVGRSTSKAILVSDPNFSVAALDARSRESGLLTGTLQGICRFRYLTEHADVKVGDQVLTSKLSAAFPDGLLIGSIVDVQASLNSHTVECLVAPAVDLAQLEEVIIIKDK